MRLFNRSRCVAYWRLHPTTRAALTLWVTRMEAESFASLNDVQTAFSRCKVLGGDRVRFEIGSHRLIAAFNVKFQAVYIKFIGTHAEYDRIDALTVDED